MSNDSTANETTLAPFDKEDADVPPARTTIATRLLAMVDDNKVVLEIGGEGDSLSPLLKARGCRVFSVQPRSDDLNRTEPYCERLIVGDLERLDLERETGNARFDVVLAAGVLTRVKDPAALLKNLASLLRPFGCIIAAVPNVGHLSVRLAMLAGRSPYEGGNTNPSDLRFFTRETLVNLFDNAGFAIARLDRHEEMIASAEPDTGPFVMPDLVDVLRKDPDANTSHFLIAAYHLPSPAGDALKAAVNELRARREDLELDAARAALTINELRSEECRYQREVEHKEDEARALNAQQLRRDEIVQSLSTQLDQHRTELSRLTSVLEGSRAEIAAATDRLERERAEAAHLRGELRTIETEHERERAEHERERAEHERERAEHEREQAEHEREQAEHERERAEHERERAEQHGAIASLRERALRAADEAAAVRDSRAMRVARWLRGDLDLWERVPTESVLKRDAIRYGFHRNGFALRESDNLQVRAIDYPLYPLPVRLNGVRGVALQVAVAVPGCGGVIGAELVSSSNEVVTRGTLSLDLVSDQVPALIKFEPTDVGVDGWRLRIFVEASRSPVRILEFQRCRVPIERALERRPFCSIVV